MGNALTPYLNLEFWDYTDLFGSLTYPGESVLWNNLAAQQDGARPDYQLTNFELSPDGNYILQKSIIIPQSITTSNFTVNAGDTGVYGTSTFASGTTYLWQSDTTVGKVSNLTSTFAHAADVFGGFSVGLYLGFPTGTLTASNCYFDLYLNDYLKLHIAATEPISLQYYTGTSWVIVDQMDASSDSETYLNQNGRRLKLDFVPLFDASFWADYPLSAAYSAPPPDCLQVSINNGDAVLIWKLVGGTFAASDITIIAQHGAWSFDYGIREYYQYCTIEEPTQVYEVDFQGDPIGYLPVAYLPYGSTYTVMPIYPGGYYNQVAATVYFTGTNLDHTTGYCTSTCAINQVGLRYAPQFNQTYGGPLFSIGAERIVDFTETMTFDQQNMCRRAAVEVILRNDDGAYSPGKTLNIGNYGVIFSWGWTDSSTGYKEIEQRFVGMLNVSDTSNPTFSNFWDNGINYCKLVLQERVVDDLPIGYVLPYDGESVFTALWELAIKMGFAPSQIGFDYIPRGTQGDYTYHLSYGTSFAPNWLPQPNQSCWEYMLQLTSQACGLNALGNPLPLVLYVDSGGILQCYGYDIGIFDSPPALPGKTFQAAEIYENGVSTLSQFVGNMSTSSNLANIRTCIILEGINPVDGSPVLSYYNNNTIDGSIYSNPRNVGYIGFPKPYININKYLSSQAAANYVLYTAVSQLSMPAIEAQFEVLAQPGIFPVTGYYGNQEIAVYEPFCTGTDAAVGFYVTQIVTHYNNTGTTVSFTSQITARLYGQYSV